jgi:MoxR-like ATPase
MAASPCGTRFAPGRRSLTRRLTALKIAIWFHSAEEHQHIFAQTVAIWRDSLQPSLELFARYWDVLRNAASLRPVEALNEHPIYLAAIDAAPRTAPHLVHAEGEGMIPVDGIHIYAVLHAAAVAVINPAGFHNPNVTVFAFSSL